MKMMFDFRESDDLQTDMDKYKATTYPKRLLFELWRKRVKNT